MTITGSHNAFLVALSLIIAALASYAALDLAGRIRATKGWASRAWLLTAAVALGGVWSKLCRAFSRLRGESRFIEPITANEASSSETDRRYD